jgi:hypothetical protein
VCFHGIFFVFLSEVWNEEEKYFFVCEVEEAKNNKSSVKKR